MRIKGYVGKLPQPRTFRGRRRDPAPAVRRAVSHAHARRTGSPGRASHVQGGERPRWCRPTIRALAKTMEGVDFEKPLPPLWKEFDALRHVPLMVIRGANSDLLSADDRHGDGRASSGIETPDVPDQGHAPLLAEAETIARIAASSARCEGSRSAEAGEAGTDRHCRQRTSATRK